jgi:hypothetical protein
MTINEPLTTESSPSRHQQTSAHAPIDSLPHPRYAYLNGGCLHLRSEHYGWFHSPQHNRLSSRGTVAGVSRTVSNCIYCCDLPTKCKRGIRLVTVDRPGGLTAVLKWGPWRKHPLTE